MWKKRYRGDVDEGKNTLPTQYRTPTHQDLRRELGINTFGQRVYNDDHLLKKYEDRFVRWDFVDDKKVRIDTRISNTHVYDPNATRKYINLNKYGTETPEKDYAYLERKRQLDAREARINKSEEHGPLNIRKALSKKKLGGGRIVEGQHQTHVDKRRAKLVKEREKLAILKEGTSFDVLTLDEAKKDQAEITNNKEINEASSDKYTPVKKDIKADELSDKKKRELYINQLKNAQWQ